MRIIKVISFILAIVITAVFVSCGTDLSSTAEESRTVMTVDSWEVPYEMYRYAAMMHLRDQLAAISANDENASETASDGDGADQSQVMTAAVEKLSEEEKETLAAAVEKYSTQTIVNTYSIFTAAKEAGIDPFGDMIDSLTEMEMEEIRATYENDREYLETIKLFFMTDNVYSILTRYEIVFNQLYELYVKNGDIDVSDEAVIEYMKGDDAVRAKQILVSFERHSDTEALAIAEDILEELSEHISDEGVVDEAQFDSLTDKYGEDLFMFKNRDGYYIARGYSDTAFEEAAFSLDVGHVSGVVRTSAGYSIIMRAKKDNGFIEENLDTLKDTCVGGIYRSMLDEYSANAEIENNDEFSKIDIFSMK